VGVISYLLSLFRVVLYVLETCSPVGELYCSGRDTFCSGKTPFLWERHIPLWDGSIPLEGLYSLKRKGKCKMKKCKKTYKLKFWKK